MHVQSRAAHELFIMGELMNRLSLSAALLCIAAAPAFADGHAQGPVGYGLAGDGTKLVVFPGLTSGGETIKLKGGAVDAIAFRPVTGELLGFSKSGAVYTVDTSTGKLTSTGASFAPEVTMGADAAVAFDFNNKLDAVRAVSEDGVNVVYFPTNFEGDKANKVLRFTDPFYADGDANAGATPAIFANAYTNAVNGAKQDATFQYALDANTNALVSLANNAGELKTIAPLTLNGEAVNVSTAGGFEIISEAAGKDKAMALLSMEGADASGLYSVNLKSGALTMLTKISGASFTGFAAGIK